MKGKTVRANRKKSSAPQCVFCGRSGYGVQFVIFTPRFQPFGTACTDCEETLPPNAQPDLMNRFAATAPEFQAEIQGMAERCGKTVAHVYALWRKYSDSCQASDQSAVLGEFQQWYAKDLQPQEKAA